MSRTIILYFSNTNHTKKVAEEMAATLGADLFRILPEIPYSAADLDWNNPSSRANQEQNDPQIRPAYQGSLPDIDSYDTIIIGHPIWWGTPPQLILSVLEDLPLTGKTVLPFATSGGSGYNQSQMVMSELAGSSVKNGRVLSSPATVKSWLQSNALL
ncbi:flavodoxin [Streptococcus chenjunshii]|uniref:Flavodoxin n=1 Tax=Streptococcus chenjunshii TaxID=2173853 RepID=A0A372KNW8_9STRE|nr:flavodoxin [Streptococcus chenjunshii]AXQ78786.1 flavodoxin [Streptococcus chenjunshii]RFU51547.1 flavodoxin [Streptococcus chenjunshii]RFU53666.1 flavodoxin [Streptococcus chenjunshii]